MPANDALLLGGLAGNLLSLPRQVENQQQQSLLTRSLLQSLAGMTPEQAQAASPDPRLGWLSAGQGGTAGKILGPVGDIGMILSSVLGHPVNAPRVKLGEVAALSQLGALKQKQEAYGKVAGTLKVPAAQEAARAGNLGAASRFENPTQARGSSNINALLDQRSRLDQTDPTQKAEYDRLSSVIDQAQKFRVDVAREQGDALTPILNDRADYNADVGLKKDLRTDAAKKYNGITNVYQTVIPLMKQAQAALTSNPAVAGLGLQRPINWWRRLNGDEAAQALSQLPSQAAQLARTQDVGNLSEPEQKVWHAFINGDDMTAQQFAASLNILDRLLRSSAQAYKRIYETGELQDIPALEGNVPGVDAGKGPKILSIEEVP